MDLAFIARRLDAYERLIRLDKPIGTLLLLWPTLWAVWLASYGAPRLDIVMIFVVGTLLMRWPAARSTTTPIAASIRRWSALARGRSPRGRSSRARRWW